MNFRSKHSLKFVSFVTLVRKSVSKFAGNDVESLNGKTRKQVHKNFCCLDPLNSGSLESIYLLQYNICCRALLIS